MSSEPQASSWFDPLSLNSRLDSAWEQRDFTRLWRGFMTARIAVAVMLLLLQLGLTTLGQTLELWQLLICSGYFVAALWSRAVASPQRLGHSFDLPWVMVIGVDVLAFIGLHFSVSSSINYTPLLALPVLMASLIGSLSLALGTAASVTVLLLIHGLWVSLRTHSAIPPYLLQPALTGTGFFIIAFLAHQLSERLMFMEQRARRHQFSARIQQQVNALVIGAMNDGILVVDARGTVHAANPAAREMLKTGARALETPTFDLHQEPGWFELVEITYRVFADPKGELQQDIRIQHDTLGARRVHVRTQLTGIPWGDGDNLSVIFLQDLRELEARVRTEKLASMGRMSAAVAHEIRNPLAAISQANALLDEDLHDAHLKRLTHIIAQNSRRLEKIVDDILNLARVGALPGHASTASLELVQTVTQACREWAEQNGCVGALSMRLSPPVWVQFEADHLRRVLINLLDNAKRYASLQADAIQVHIEHDDSEVVKLSVWSDSPPLEPSVQQHLFEPFFSSESRSSGLGLYICRTLCEGHDASISYQRVVHPARHQTVAGNAFVLALRSAARSGNNGGMSPKS